MTRVIILAAGTGTRLRPHTEDRPKALVPLLGRPLLAHQLAVLRAAGIRPQSVALVTGHAAEAFLPWGLTSFHNRAFAHTNMVASLACARDWFDGGDDVLVSYGDIVYEPAVLARVLQAPGPLAVAVDRGWLDLWRLRMDDPLADAETMRLDDRGHILELGRKPGSLEEIQGQYIGLIRIDRLLAPRFFDAYDTWPAGLPGDAAQRETLYMTSYLQWLIDHGTPAQAALIEHGWLELDTTQDVARYAAAAEQGRLPLLYRPES